MHRVFPSSVGLFGRAKASTDEACSERPDLTVHEIDPISTSYKPVRTGVLRKTLIFRVLVYAHNLLKYQSSTCLVHSRMILVPVALVFTVAALPP